MSKINDLKIAIDRINEKKNISLKLYEFNTYRRERDKYFEKIRLLERELDKEIDNLINSIK